MARIQISNRVINHKHTIYQISQIVSIKKIEIKRERVIHLAHLKPKNSVLPWIVFVLIVVCFSSFVMEEYMVCGLSFLSVIVSACVLFILNRNMEEYNKKIEFDNEEKEKLRYFNDYGLSLRMSNGDKPLFMSSESIVTGMHKALTDAINEEQNISVSFEGVNIEINDSENINIGGVTQT